jgi:hypothetical protein
LLEDRLVMSWLGAPPAAIAPPNSTVAAKLDSLGDARGAAAIVASEADYYSFVAPVSGKYLISATTPSSPLDPVLGVFDASGRRLAYDDDGGAGVDSQLAIRLSAGSRYYVGIAGDARSSAGAYNWLIDGPASDDALSKTTLARALRTWGR